MFCTVSSELCCYCYAVYNTDMQTAFTSSQAIILVNKWGVRSVMRVVVRSGNAGYIICTRGNVQTHGHKWECIYVCTYVYSSCEGSVLFCTPLHWQFAGNEFCEWSRPWKKHTNFLIYVTVISAMFFLHPPLTAQWLLQALPSRWQSPPKEMEGVSLSLHSLSAECTYGDTH